MFDLFGVAARRFARPAYGPVDPVHPGWPESTPQVCLPDGTRVRLRPLLRRDGEDWSQLRILDEERLRPVEPTVNGSWALAHSATQWWSYLSGMRDAALGGTVVPLVIEVDGHFGGQVTLGGIQHGAASECWIGYWVYSGLWGRGIATAACALGVDHAVDRVGLHRVTATYLDSNPASGAVLAHNGFEQEGYLRANLHIDGRWQDHYFVARLAGPFPGSCVADLREQGRVR
ncbi:GNAT family N-acetyltransferase [Corynebacterium uberis]|uniref:GNAT family N-acetyltransferase n=1 Tax=Corynebacterium TaxID=1716 RepID=UPI001D0B42F6|nr:MULTISPECIES: GNAT family protein [Corynebacterium]MCZ9308781.1 GNAT family N-acetyltransferase [Corynebacterium sp. c6VSa_13]UDL72690.1 GNAT family N-acetyltransferase [Corynebacterium uberis]UDL76434.1 GNAT family N-acetyltransferase [Corynebacterium uberis]UDL78646.1 GNAT family N-acetyltransferase [Corynebacterium uberis]UDL80925.1 GNAT family N-acetyltransferase [Corynebacterium uberis]